MLIQGEVLGWGRVLIPGNTIFRSLPPINPYPHKNVSHIMYISSWIVISHIPILHAPHLPYISITDIKYLFTFGLDN